jgi:hypothetical protein
MLSVVLYLVLDLVDVRSDGEATIVGDFYDLDKLYAPMMHADRTCAMKNFISKGDAANVQWIGHNRPLVLGFLTVQKKNFRVWRIFNTGILVATENCLTV